MPPVAEVFDLKDVVLGHHSFGPREIERLSRAIADDYSKFGQLRDAAGELAARADRTPADAVRLGVCYHLLGRYRDAIDTLRKADGGALALFYVGRSQFALEQYSEAVASYEAAKKAGYDKDVCAVSAAEATRCGGDAAAALTRLDDLSGPIEQTADYLYQRGATVAAMCGSPGEITALYERAVQVDGRHAGALFGLALENDRYGNDERAVELYQRSAAVFPSHVGALLNLGVLYEDRGHYDRAQTCYQRILDAYPRHDRALMFARDAAASGNVMFDEDALRRRERVNQVLNVPVTDFELSVRARNCLQKMGVRTLGDLTRTTEQELLASKNFGETSLVEIRDMLASKGLQLGQFAHEKVEQEAAIDLSALPADAQVLLDRPLSDLNLSVRARKCMVRLSLNTLGELIRKTADDLLDCKNFGVTSLNEVREKLANVGLKLRGD